MDKTLTNKSWAKKLREEDNNKNKMNKLEITQPIVLDAICEVSHTRDHKDAAKYASINYSVYNTALAAVEKAIGDAYWKPIKKGEDFPCKALFMDKNGEIPSNILHDRTTADEDGYYLDWECLTKLPRLEK